MKLPHLKWTRKTPLPGGTMLLALTGWMDGGLVSTGTVQRMIEDRRGVTKLAEINPDPFYIFNAPGPMEIAALFRPDVTHDAGIITSLEMPTNIFRCDRAANLAFFIGKEPNLRWQEFADCIFQVVEETKIARIIFIGSFGGTVPHTREPRMYGSVSHEHLRPLIEEYGARPSEYHGPASFASLLLHQAPDHDVEMLNLVAEIPGYLQGMNPLSIETVSRRVAKLTNQPVNLDKLRELSNEWEVQVTEAVEKDHELAETVRKLEEQYDNELIGHPPPEEEDEEEEAED